jgi:hypothetical protein
MLGFALGEPRTVARGSNNRFWEEGSTVSALGKIKVNS